MRKVITSGRLGAPGIVRVGNVEVRLLGAVGVVVEGELVELAAAKPRTVLALLALSAGRSVAVEQLIDAVWADSPPDSARRTLQSYVRDLRRAYGTALIETTASGYLLAVDSDDVDALLLERRADTARETDALISTLLATPLPGCVDTPLVAAEAARLRELLRTRFLEGLDHRADRGETGPVIADAERWLGREPLADDVWVRLVMALSNAGRASEALRAFQRARQALAEAGLEPSPELRAAEAAALAVERRGAPVRAVDVPRPSGTVTFLFTDIERSTALWEQHHDEMAEAVERHDRLVPAAIEDAGGHVFAVRGDGFAAAFDSGPAAARATIALQRTIGDQLWPGGATIRIRIGLHTGFADERDGGYFGPTVNRTARVCDAAHGGQIVATTTTVELLGDVQSIPLGRHRLRGVSEPVGLRQLVADGLTSEFPPLRSMSSSLVTLPAPVSSLIGREEDVASLAGLVAEHRLVTLTGVGGCGKTRLAIAVAHAVRARFPDGVFFVDLSRVSDPDHVAAAFGDGVGYTAGPDGEHLADRIMDVLADREALVVVDNCEHLLDPVAELVEGILHAGEHVRVLATSREALEIEGERPVRVKSLGVGPSGPAVELFLDRAGSALAEPTEEDRDTIAELCRRLDGMPLAIELAAGRVDLLSPAELLDRIDERFMLLTAGRRRTRGRQQTLEAAVDWSFDLLEPEERAALLSVSVMPGLFTLELAAATIGTTAETAFRLLDSLAARSLVQTTTDLLDRPAYRLLETIRVYAATRLRQSDDPHGPFRRHARHLADIDMFSEVEWQTRADEFQTLGEDWLAARGWAVANGESDLARELAPYAVIQLSQRQLFAESMDLCGRCIAESTDPERTGLLHMLAGQTLLFTAEFAAAFEHMSAALELRPHTWLTAPVRYYRSFLAAWMAPGLCEGDLTELDRFERHGYGFLGALASLGRGHQAFVAGDIETAMARFAHAAASSDDISRLTGIGALLIATATSEDPASGVPGIEGHPALESFEKPLLRATPQGRLLVANGFLATAVAASAAKDDERAIFELDRALALRDSTVTSDAIENEVAATVASVLFHRGERDRADELMQVSWLTGFVFSAYPVVLRAMMAGIPRSDWVHWLRAEGMRMIATPPDADARDRLVEENLVHLGLRGN
jgi:predicted ATPase/class 3 adenylate cyclase